MKGEKGKNLPILVIYFNRPQHLELLLLALKSFLPKVIYFSCDGPRKDNSLDIQNIKKCDQLIKLHVDWKCDIKILKADSNHGCDAWVPKSITWLFEQETQGLILEDDCIIDSHFYHFSSELLDRYKDSQEIMSISALSFFGDDPLIASHSSYHYSCYPLTWAWATWRRAWVHYQDVVDLDRFDLAKQNWLISNGFSRGEIEYWKKFFIRLQRSEVTYWDAKWIYSVWMRNALSITPNVNLVKNVGVGSDATHTKTYFDIPQLTIQRLPTTLAHPKKMLVDHILDRRTFTKKFQFTFKKKVLLILKILMGGG